KSQPGLSAGEYPEPIPVTQEFPAAVQSENDTRWKIVSVDRFPAAAPFHRAESQRRGHLCPPKAKPFPVQYLSENFVVDAQPALNHPPAQTLQPALLRRPPDPGLRL